MAMRLQSDEDHPRRPPRHANESRHWSGAHAGVFRARGDKRIAVRWEARAPAETRRRPDDEIGTDHAVGTGTIVDDRRLPEGIRALLVRTHVRVSTDRLADSRPITRTVSPGCAAPAWRARAGSRRAVRQQGAAGAFFEALRGAFHEDLLHSEALSVRLLEQSSESRVT